MVGDEVNGAPQGDFPDWPRSIVGQVGGQNADPQLALGRTHTILPPAEAEILLIHDCQMSSIAFTADQI